MGIAGVGRAGSTDEYILAIHNNSHHTVHLRIVNFSPVLMHMGTIRNGRTCEKGMRRNAEV